MDQPIAASISWNNTTEARNSSEKEADGLYKRLFFAKGQKVLLTRNQWSEAGLVNGSLGFIEYIVYFEGNDPPQNCQTADARMPDLLLVRFPNYTGPSFLQNREHIVPITPIEAVWMNKKREILTRRQFPLIYGDALTVHKAQGKQLYINRNDIISFFLSFFIFNF